MSIRKPFSILSHYIKSYVQKRLLLTAVLLGCLGFAFDAYDYVYDWIKVLVVAFPIITASTYAVGVWYTHIKTRNQEAEGATRTIENDRVINVITPLICFFSICSVVSFFLFGLYLKTGDPNKETQIRLVLENSPYSVTSSKGDYILLSNVAEDGTEIELTKAPQPIKNSSEVSRPLLVDRNGTILAGSVQSKRLIANINKIDDPEEYAQKIASILPDIEPRNLSEKLSSNDQIVTIQNELLPHEAKAIQDLDLIGIKVEEWEKRSYPQNNLFSHVIGFIARNKANDKGLEKKLICGAEANIKPADCDTHDCNALGLHESLLKCDTQDPIYLTLDANLQNIVRSELKAQMEKFSAKASVGIVLSAKNGEVLAMVSLPDFNPNQANKYNREAHFNRATQGVYELGAVFKTFTFANAFYDAVLKTEDTFDASEPLKIDDKLIRDYHAQDKILSVQEIFTYSSNIGTAQIAQKLGQERQVNFFEDLRLLDKPKLILSEVGQPLTPLDWNEYDTVTLSYGHGIAVPPISLAAAYVAIVNGGYLYNPSFVKGLNQDGHRVIDSETSNKMRVLLQQAVEEGTSAKAKSSIYKIGGKTGTAEKVINGRYDSRKIISSFAGAFPINDPEYVIFIMFDEPKGIRDSYGYATGGWVAAPVAKRIMEKAGPILNLKIENVTD